MESNGGSSLRVEFLTNNERGTVNGGLHQQNKDDKVYSLAFYKTTPRCSVYAVSFCMFLSHALFIVGQVSIMWCLLLGVDFSGSFHAVNFETRELFRLLKIENPFVLNVSLDYYLDNFTYGTAVDKLWIAEGLNSKIGPRTCAMILILFSGAWPHLKLLLLHYFWLFPSPSSVRTSVFYWLSTFGKWSLVDVIVVCVLIGVVHLDIHLDSDMILHRVQNEIPEVIKVLEKAVSEKEAVQDICNGVFKLKEGALYSLCSGIVYEVYYHPHLVDILLESVFKGISSNGGGLATLRISGLIGIYIFSSAVIISLSLSLVIEYYDHHARSSTRYERRASIADPGRRYFILYDSVASDVFKLRSYVNLVLCSVIALASGLLGVFLPSMRRVVPGVVPQLINQTLNLDFTMEYSVYTLAATVGAKGGADYFLMGVFILFCLAGPLLRSFITLIQLVIPASKNVHILQMFYINTLGVFAAWDVFFLAIYLVNLEMPPITNTLLDPTSKACQALKEFGYSDTCLEIEYGVVWPGFMFLIIAFIAHMVACTYAIKLGYHGLDPFHDGDGGGPYCPDYVTRLFWSIKKEEEY